GHAYGNAVAWTISHGPSNRFTSRHISTATGLHGMVIARQVAPGRNDAALSMYRRNGHRHGAKRRTVIPFSVSLPAARDLPLVDQNASRSSAVVVQTATEWPRSVK